MTTGRFRLAEIHLGGFKSIGEEPENICFGDATLLLGANGAGKSNLVAFFRMLSSMSTGALQQYIANQGYGESLLHYGPRLTKALVGEILFRSNEAEAVYRFRLAHSPGDTLAFDREEVEYRSSQHLGSKPIELGVGHKESRLEEDATGGGKTSRFVFNLLRKCQVFQFHDTSPTAKIRNQGYIEDARHLRSDGGNLAAFLRAMRENAGTRKHYDRITRHIRLVFPQFGDFDLGPSTQNEKYILLNWREKGSDHLFGPHQLSDGTLRFAALTSLLLQPPDGLPTVLVVDEPELGLHPAAISALAGMVKSAAMHCQVVMATQSPRLVDEFAVEDIVIVERNAQTGASTFRRLDSQQLAEWLDAYCLSELWEKNVLGGKP